VPRSGDDFWFFPPYVPVGERRAHAAQALARLLKKSKRAPQPIAASRSRTLTTTFWGKAWCANLERYADFASRLPRGRSYARNGSVVDLVIGRGTVRAYVAGSELYETTVRVAPMRPVRWRAVVSRCTGRIGSLVGLLKGELSGEVLAVLTDAREGLFPEPREIDFDCSCPDQAAMCKHVAAVLYGVGVRLDAQPELFFALRDVDQTQLLASAATGAPTRTQAAGVRRIAGDKLAEVFGIDIEAGTAAGAARQRPGSSPAAGQDAAAPKTSATRKSAPASARRRGTPRESPSRRRRSRG
jgi:uncharacterized Zn finger protein